MAFIGNSYITQGFAPAIDYFSGNASTTAFTLSRPVASVAQVQAVIENVPQNPGSAYTVSGSTITFTSAPPSGTNNIYVYYTSPITQVFAPAQGTVSPTSMTAGAPTWTALGGVSLPRIDSSSEGGQLNFNRASDDTATWSIDSYGSTSTPTLRMIDGVNVRAFLDGSGNFGFNSGYGSAATAYGCRAWVNFNGTGTVAIRASGNVTSITDNGTGAYAVNFTNAMPDANFAVSGWARVSGSGGTLCGENDSALTTSSARVGTINAAGTFSDALFVTVAIFR